MASAEALKMAVLTPVQTGVQDTAPLATVSQATLIREARRPAWAREMAAEFLGVFLYVFFGVAATAAFVFAQLAQSAAQLLSGSASAEAQLAARTAFAAGPAGAPASNVEVLEQDAAIKALNAIIAYAKIPNSAGNGNILTVGLAFGLGIAFAIITCAPVSGGHFSPAMTVLAMVLKKFPLMKGLRFILAQLLGGLSACAMVYGLYHEQFEAVQTGVLGTNSDARNALVKIFCSSPDPTQGMGYLFMIEFFVCFFMSLVTMACMDQANPFLSLQTAPMTIGMIYALCVWGFGELNISLNTAKDLPGRLVAGLIVGKHAWTYKHTAWIGTLVNIPAMLLAALVYSAVFQDSQKHVDMGLMRIEGEKYDKYSSPNGIEHREIV